MKKLFTCALIIGSLFSQNKAVANMSCDTVINLTSRDTLTYYINSADAGGGYLSGNNGYGDVEKAEALSGPLGGSLNGAFIGFGYANVLAGDSATTVTINAYDATGTGGAPGATIATATVTLGQIALSVGTGGLYVPFTTPATLASNNFFISVVLPTTGDTIVLLTNTLTSLDGNGWERWSDNSWNPYNTTYLTYPYYFGNDIAAVVCGGGPLAAFQSSQANTCGTSLTVNFYNTSSNGVDSVKWNFQGGTPSTSTSNNPTVSYTGTGAYTVQLIAYGNSSSDTTYNTVTISPAITGSVTTTPASSSTASDGSATVTGAGGAGALSFYWSDANQDTTEVVSGLSAGTYTVTISDAIGCFTVETAVITYTNSIINLGANKTVKIYPNPANEFLNIDWNTASSADIRISDMTGRVVETFNTENSVTNSFNIHNLATGSYLITLTDKSTNATQTVKFIKL